MRISHVILKNLATGSVGRMVGVLTPILLVPLMIRVWGVEVYGEWLILTAIPTYIMLSPDLGLAGAVVNRMAFLTAEGAEQHAVYLYRSSFLVLAITAGAFVGVGWLIAPSIDWSFVGVTSLKPPASAAIIGWSCVQIFIAQQGFLLSGIYRSARRNPRLGLLQSLGGIFTVSVGVVVLWGNGTPHQYVITLALAHTVFFLTLFIDSRRIMPNFTLSRHGVSLKCLRPYVVPGLGQAGMPFIHALQNQGVLIVLGGILGPAAVGLFQTGRVITNGVKSLLGLTAGAIRVELPALLGEGRTTTAERLLIRNSQIGAALTAGAIVTMVLVGEAIYQEWLGDQAQYHPVMILLLLASLVPYMAGQSFTVLLEASNQIHVAIGPLIIVAISSIACVAAGAFLGGLAGSALSIILWEAGMAAVVIIIAARNYGQVKNYCREVFNLKLLLKDILLVLK